MSDLGIDGFVDAEEIGRGGFGIVFRARQPALNRWVAIKMLAASLSADGRERLGREARALGALSGHPAVVPVYALDVTAGGQPYLVMPWYPAGSLADRLATSGPLRWEDAVELAIQIAGGLETAHRCGVLHRDVKPANILLDTYGRPRLGDFGIARVAGEFETTSRHITASVAHAAPEVLDGAAPTVAADIYGLGSTLYSLIAGRPAFVTRPDESLVALYVRIARDPPAPPAGLDPVPADLWAVIAQAMAKSPIDRPGSADAFAALLADVQDEHGLARTVPVIGGERPVDAVAVDPPTATVTASGGSIDVTGGRQRSRQRGRQRSRLLGAAGALTVLAIVGVIVAALVGDGDGTTAAPTTVAPASVVGSGVPSGSGAAAGELDCAVFPADDPWNLAVDQLPRHPSSDRWIEAMAASLASAGLGELDPAFGTDIGTTYSVVGADQPLIALTFADDSARDVSDPGPFPIPAEAASDEELTIVVDDDACVLYELLGTGDGERTWNSVYAAVAWDLETSPRRPADATSADQAGLPVFPGLVRYDEVVAGAIEHALRFSTIDVDYAYLAPASHAAGDEAETDLPPFGARLRLRADFPCAELRRSAEVVCTALQRYGMLLADEGNVFAVSGALDPRWIEIDEIDEDLARIGASDFEVVDTGAVPVEPG